jgi:hypothetical protein
MSEQSAPQGIPTIIQFSSMPIKVYFFSVNLGPQTQAVQIVAQSMDECMDTMTNKLFPGIQYQASLQGSWEGNKLADGLAKRGVFASIEPQHPLPAATDPTNKVEFINRVRLASDKFLAAEDAKAVADIMAKYTV